MPLKGRLCLVQSQADVSAWDGDGQRLDGLASQAISSLVENSSPASLLLSPSCCCRDIWGASRELLEHSSGPGHGGVKTVHGEGRRWGVGEGRSGRPHLV